MVTILAPQVAKRSTAPGYQPVPNGLAKNSPQAQDDPDKQRVATETQ